MSQLNILWKWLKYFESGNRNIIRGEVYKMKRRYFLYSCTLLLVILLFSACNNGESSSSEVDNSNKSENETGNDSTEDTFYEGKSIELLVPFGPGGGSDVTARFEAPYLSKFIAGSPSVQVINEPGGGSISGVNIYENSRDHNGENLLLAAESTYASYLLGNPDIQYDLLDFTPLMGIPNNSILYISSDVGYEDPKDFLDIDLYYGAVNATGADIVTLLAFEILGVDANTIFGYDGRGATRVAFEQGELNFDSQTVPSYLENVEPLVDGGKAIPLFNYGVFNEDGEIVRDPKFPDMLTFVEFYEEIHGDKPSGQAFQAMKALMISNYSLSKMLMVHDDAPTDAINALKEAASSIANDKEFLEEGEEILGGYTPIYGEQLESLVKESFDVDDEVINWVIDLLEDKYDEGF